jgi:hypothetical protein
VNKNDIYTDYLRGIIFWGRITLLGAFLLSFLPVLYLALFHGVMPPVSLILAGVGLVGLSMMASYLIEPITYFPILGVSGSYMSWLAGNIFNLRVPVSIVAQNAAGVTEGTPEGDIISTLGMGVSVFVNLLILFVAVLLGVQFLDAVPPVIQGAFHYILPSIFGAFLVAYVARYPKLAAVVIPVGVIALLAGVPEGLVLIICLAVSIGFGSFLFKKGWIKSVPF